MDKKKARKLVIPEVMKRKYHIKKGHKSDHIRIETESDGKKQPKPNNE